MKCLGLQNRIIGLAIGLRPLGRTAIDDTNGHRTMNGLTSLPARGHGGT